MLLAGIGSLLAIVGYIWIVVIAFQDNVGWGIGSLLCFIAGLVYVAQHWEATKKPFLIWLAGFVLSMIGQGIGLAGAAGGAGGLGN